jgi:hypothetical protein
MLRSLRQHFKTHLNGTTMDLSNLSASSLHLQLNYYRDLDFLICFLGASIRRTGQRIEVLSLENNRIRKCEALTRIKIYLPDLRTLKMGGNAIEDPSPLDRLAHRARIEVVTDAAAPAESPDESDDADEQSVEESDSDKPEASVPAISSPADDPRTLCVKPWLDRLIAQSETDIRGTGSFYAEDACFSIFFGKLGMEWGHLFASNRNLKMRGTGVPQICGKEEISEKLGTLFEGGFRLLNVTTRVGVVSGLFYAVSMYGIASINAKNLAMMRSMVVVGHNRRLFITNDVISLRYDRDARERPRT